MCMCEFGVCVCVWEDLMNRFSPSNLLSQEVKLRGFNCFKTNQLRTISPERLPLHSHIHTQDTEKNRDRGCLTSSQTHAIFAVWTWEVN